MKTKKQEEKQKTSFNKMDGIDNFLDLLSLSVKGLLLIIKSIPFGSFIYPIFYVLKYFSTSSFAE